MQKSYYFQFFYNNLTSLFEYLNLDYYFSNGNPQKAIELLEYAATNEVKDAQKDLVLVYTNGQYIEPNDEKALFYDNLYQDGKEDFTKKIYGR